MKICKKCGKEFRSTATIDGKKRNLCSRKYCFECSPWGSHNNRNFEKGSNLDENGKRVYPERTCPSCGEKHRHRGHYCYMCNFNKRAKATEERVLDLVGNKCWICGYNKTKKNLCFHHIDSANKLTNLDIRSIQKMSWDKAIEEMKKCIFVCHNCHGEIHYNILKDIDVRVAFEKWRKIETHKNNPEFPIDLAYGL